MSFFSNMLEQAKKTNNQIALRNKELKKINEKCLCNRDVVKELNNTINAEEKLIYFIDGIYNSKCYNVFITNRRVLFIPSIAFYCEEFQIPIEKISSIGTVKWLLSSTIKIRDESSIGIEVCQVKTKQATTFVNKVNEQLNDMKTFSIQINKNVEKDILDKIEKLSELYKDGVLTEYEFNMKKMELLEKLKK